MRLLKPALCAALMLGTAAPAASADVRLDLDGDLGEALRKLFDEMKPHLDEALEMLEEFEGLNAIDDPRHYQMPEILPNGDIIIRRRPDAPDFRSPDPDETPGTDDETIDL